MYFENNVKNIRIQFYEINMQKQWMAYFSMHSSLFLF